MKRVISSILIAVVCIELVFIAVGRLKKHLPTLADRANTVIATCTDTGYAPSCYDREIPKLMDRISMEEAFEVTKIVQKKDARYLYCHVLGHNVSARETKKDPSKWKDVVARCPTTFCNNGCQHGALMARFNAESLSDAQIQAIIPDLSDVCEPRGNWHPREVERSMCYHALGHLHMYITKADIKKSARLCETVGIKEDGRTYVQTCTQGVLMSVFQPLEPEDFALVRDIAPTAQSVPEFCSRFTGETWFACRSESWPLFFDDITSPEGLVRFCSYTDDPSRKRNCISTVMSILTVTMVTSQNGTLDSIEAYCDRVPNTLKGACLGETAFRLVQIDPRYAHSAAQLCASTRDSAASAECFTTLLTHVGHSFIKGSRAAAAFCREMPEEAASMCISKSH